MFSYFSGRDQVLGAWIDAICLLKDFSLIIWCVLLYLCLVSSLVCQDLGYKKTQLFVRKVMFCLYMNFPKVLLNKKSLLGYVIYKSCVSFHCCSLLKRLRLKVSWYCSWSERHQLASRHVSSQTDRCSRRSVTQCYKHFLVQHLVRYVCCHCLQLFYGQLKLKLSP